jgi:hypothetical protein
MKKEKNIDEEILAVSDDERVIEEDESDDNDE